MFMHKSSPFTFFHRYILPLLVVAFNIFILNFASTEENQNMFIALSIALFWGMLSLLASTFRLRRITADEDGIRFKENGEEVFIPYENMYWLTKLDLYCPNGITLKYKETNSGLEKKVAFIPRKMQKGIKHQSPLTQFIWQGIKEKVNIIRRV